MHTEESKLIQNTTIKGRVTNGEQMAVERSEIGNGRFEVRSVVPGAMVSEVDNLLEIESMAWIPAKERGLRSWDERHLVSRC